MAALNYDSDRAKIPANGRNTDTKNVNRDNEKRANYELTQDNQCLTSDYSNSGRSYSPSFSDSDHTLLIETQSPSGSLTPRNPISSTFNHSKNLHPGAQSMGDAVPPKKEGISQSGACRPETNQEASKASSLSKERAPDSFSEDLTESETEMEATDAFENVGRLFRFNSRQVPMTGSSNYQALYPMFTYSSGRNIAEWTSASQGTAKQEFFCNVIQHHNLEDQLTNLQQKLFQFQLAENPLEVINLRKELAGKDERIRQLESTILKLNSNDVKDMNTSADSANVSIDVFKARVLSLKAALGQCSSVSERTIDKFLNGACGLEDLRELVERAQSAGELATEASQMEDKVAQLDTKYEHFQNLIIQCEEKSKSLDEQLCKKFRELDDAEAKWSQYQKQGQILALDLEKAAQDLSETNSTVELLRGEIKKLTEKKALSRNEVEELETSIKNKRKQFEQIEASCNDAVALLKRAKQEESEIQDSLEDYDRMLEEKENELKLLEKQVSKLTSEESEAKKCFLKQAETLKLVTEELQMAKEDLIQVKSTAENTRKTHENKMEALKSEVEALEERKKSVDEFLGSIQEKYESLCEKAEDEAAKIKKYLNEVDAAETRRSYLVDLMHLEETQLEGLKQQHAERISQLRDVQSQMNQEKHLLEKTENERNKCEQQLRLTQSKVANYSQRLTELQAEFDELSSQVKNLQKEKVDKEKREKDLAVNLESWEKEIKVKKEELENIESDILSQQEQSEQLKDQEKQLIEKLRTLQTHIGSQQTDYTRNSEVNNQLKSEIAANRQKFELLERGLTEMSQQMLKLQTALEQQKKDLVSGQNQLLTVDDLKKRLTDLEKANNGLSSEKEDLMKQVAELNEMSTVLRSQNHKLEDKTHQLKQTISSLRTELSRALEKNKSLEMDVEGLLSEKVALKLTVADLEHKQVENRSFFSSENMSTPRKSLGEDTPTAVNDSSASLESIKHQLKKQLEDAEQKFSSRMSSFSNTELKTKAMLNVQTLH